MGQALAPVSIASGSNYIYAPGTAPKDLKVGSYGSSLDAFEGLFNNGNSFKTPSSWERVKNLSPQRILSMRRTTWDMEVDRDKRRVASFLSAGKDAQAARAARALGDTYWSHFLIRHAEQAFFFGAAVSIGKGNLAAIDLSDVGLRDELFAAMKGVEEMQSAPSELSVGKEWPVFTPLLHGGQYGAKTQKFVGLPFVRREFRHEAPVQSSGGGIVINTPISYDKAEELRDGEIAALKKIGKAGIRVPAHLFPTGNTAYVRTFVEGETLGNLPHAVFPLTEEQRIAARVGYWSLILIGAREGLWKTEPTEMKVKAIYEPTNDRTPESPKNWVVIEPA